MQTWFISNSHTIFFNVEVGFEGLWLKGLLIMSLIEVSGIEARCNTYAKINNTLKRCHCKGFHAFFGSFLVTRDHPYSNGIIVFHILNQHLKLNCNNPWVSLDLIATTYGSHPTSWFHKLA